MAIDYRTFHETMGVEVAISFRDRLRMIENTSRENSEILAESIDIAAIVLLATEALHRRDLKNIIELLQKLPVDRTGKQLIYTDAREGDRSLNLALEVLKCGDFSQKWDIAKLLPKFGSIAIEPLIGILGDDDEDMESRWFAAQVLAELNTIDGVLALVELLKETTDEDLSSIATQSLTNMGKTAIDALNSLIDSENESLRLSAADALARMRHPDTIVSLLQMAGDNNEKIRILAIEALGSFRDSRIAPTLVKALTDVNAAVRKEAAAALGMRVELVTELDLVDRLAPLLYDLNLGVCRQAALSLGRVGTKNASEALYKVLQAHLTPLELKLDIVRSLAWNGTETALGYLQMSLRDAGVEVCREIVTVLGRDFAGVDRLREKACTVLLEFCGGRVLEATIKQTIAMSLGQLGDRRAVEILSSLAEDDDRSVVLHARSALDKLKECL
jgi:HEAT repeat protein